MLTVLFAGFSLSVFANADLKSNSKRDTFVVAIYHPMMINPVQGPWAIRKYIADKAGYNIEFRVVPSKRMPYELANGNVDAISVSSIARDIRQQVEDDGFLQANYPDRVVPIDIYYRENSDWTPSWPAEKDFLNKARGVTINYNYMTELGLSLDQIPGYQSGVFMVNYERADYWLDNIPPYSPTFNEYKKPSTDGYKKEKLLDSPLFLLFSDTERGRMFKAMIDEGMSDLLGNADKYRRIWNEDKQVFTDPVEEFLDYVQNQYPELRLRSEEFASVDSM